MTSVFNSEALPAGLSQSDPIGSRYFNAFLRKLGQFLQLDDARGAALVQRLNGGLRRVGDHQDLRREGSNSANILLLLEGFACRHKILEDGRRQILAFLLPGDFCDLQAALMETIDHDVTTVSACVVAQISLTTVKTIVREDRDLALALWQTTLFDEAIARQWMVNLGQRFSDKRMAHLLSELFWRLRTVGLTDQNGFLLPLTQQELSHSLGISVVHVNRVLHQLRALNLITMHGRRVELPDIEALRRFGQFHPGYLDLKSRGARTDDTSRAKPV